MDGFLERWFPTIFIALFVMIILMVVFEVGALMIWANNSPDGIVCPIADAVKGQ